MVIRVVFARGWPFVFLQIFKKRLVCVPQSCHQSKKQQFLLWSQRLWILNPILIFEHRANAKKKEWNSDSKINHNTVYCVVESKVLIIYGLVATTSHHILLTRTIYYTIINIIMTIYSKSVLVNQWHQIDTEWAAELMGLRMRVCGSWWNGCTEEEKWTFYSGKIKEYNHNKRR